MRTCAKMRCEAEPVATISLRYRDREVVLGPLAPERDPTVLEFCREHASKMTPPLGWNVVDEGAIGPALASASAR
jgi:hypothetical protein